jgi:hypothetical protein
MKSNLISIRRQNANRANAQKSTGPRTSAGKAKVAANALRHGLCASNFVIGTEDVGDFNHYRKSYMDRLGPRDGVEIDLIDRMVHAGWTERRTWSMENDTIDLHMKRMAPTLASDMVPPISPGERAARAIEELAKTPTLPLLHRYAARLSNEFQRALKTLLELRERVPLVPAGTPVAQALACGTEEPCETNPCPESDTPVAQALACGDTPEGAPACGDTPEGAPAHTSRSEAIKTEASSPELQAEYDPIAEEIHPNSSNYR